MGHLVWEQPLKSKVTALQSAALKPSSITCSRLEASTYAELGVPTHDEVESSRAVTGRCSSFLCFPVDDVIGLGKQRCPVENYTHPPHRRRCCCQHVCSLRTRAMGVARTDTAASVAGSCLCEGDTPHLATYRGDEEPFPHTGFSADPEHTARGHMKKHTAKPDGTKHQRRVSRSTVLHPTGEGSVFNAQNKRRETAGAAEVQEDRRLEVDLPIDQVEAKIVEEECGDGSCSPSASKAPPHDSHGWCLQRSSSAGSRNDELFGLEVSRGGQVRGPSVNNMSAGLTWRGTLTGSDASVSSRANVLNVFCLPACAEWTSKLHVPWLCLILANEEAAPVLVGHCGNGRSEVTSKAG
ncbi:unnamed protein product [Pleuronectes platessa]|uniref:Uncharacterized protein n=1 Tax=Pleuronectes platessa TaxID=8262 RepID=A0A9N7UKS7_PLEPL|nr:unnamed protein product [Pleuronectes platessa]